MVLKTKVKILDASLMANELIADWSQKGRNGVVLKLDLEKTFELLIGIFWMLFRPKVLDQFRELGYRVASLVQILYYHKWTTSCL
ncbi:uncharacterized protein LOC120090416 isoform X4 [Benincasa hispida]|uniref:uncharacterized protein LOC120090416 isoform X4 n=1 Tax=Benincasa hispida TaxID=102211 RepID=UPI0019021166|nr:uncharacterized protein LOC120090416 isoform X4 [Benincasa hispida]